MWEFSETEIRFLVPGNRRNITGFIDTHLSSSAGTCSVHFVHTEDDAMRNTIAAPAGYLLVHLA